MKNAKEKDIQHVIFQYLSLKGVFVWRNNTGAQVLTDWKGRRRYLSFGYKGSPDLIGLIPPDGKFLGIETKSKYGKQTYWQKEFQKRVESCGGIYILARNLEDIKALSL